MKSAFLQTVYPIKSDEYKEKPQTMTVWHIEETIFNSWENGRRITVHYANGIVLYRGKFVPVYRRQTEQQRAKGFRQEWLYDKYQPMPKGI